MGNIFNSIIFNIKAKKLLFVILIALSLLAIVLAVISAVNLSGGFMPIDLTNIAFIKFLRGQCGFVFLLTGTIISLLIFYLVIWVFCSKKFLFPLAVVFYLYYVYAQALVFTSILLIYGLFNSLMLLLFLLVYYFAVFSLLLLILLDLSTLGGDGYFKSCFNKSESCLPVLSLALIAVCLLFCIVLCILKSFVLLLVF